MTNPDVAPDPPDQSYLPWYRRWIPGWRTITVLAFLLLATPLGIRWYQLWWMPDVPVPFDVEAFCELPVVEENAFSYFQKAVFQHQRMPDDREFWEFFNQRNGYVAWDDLPESLQKWVVSEQPVLGLLRQGGRCAEISAIPPQSYTINTTLPVHQELRDLFRLASFDVLRLLDEGQTQAAADELHDTLQATRHLGRRGCIIERLIGIACFAHMLPAWQQWSAHPQVTAEELEAALERIRDEWQLTPPTSDQLKVEYLMVLNEAKPPMTNLRGAFDDAIETFAVQRLGLSAQATMAKLSTVAPGWQMLILWTMGEPEISVRANRLYLTHELKFCDLPFADQPPRLPRRYELYDTPELTGGLTALEIEKRLDASFASHVLGAWGQYQSAVHNEAGKQALLETGLQLQIDILRRQAASRADLEQLLGDFPWPTDPCSAERKPIQHRAEEAGLVIWSLGWDGIDQGGVLDPQANRGQDSVVLIPWPGGKPD